MADSTETVHPRHGAIAGGDGTQRIELQGNGSLY